MSPENNLNQAQTHQDRTPKPKRSHSGSSNNEASKRTKRYSTKTKYARNTARKGEKTPGKKQTPRQYASDSDNAETKRCKKDKPGINCNGKPLENIFYLNIWARFLRQTARKPTT